MEKNIKEKKIIKIIYVLLLALATKKNLKKEKQDDL